MDVICFVCNKQSPGWHRDFTQLQLQHTDTPICEFIKTLLADFELVRNIYDESNHICVECWLQFNEYDGAQTDKQKAKLRHLLLSTERKLKSIEITKSSEKKEKENEDDSHKRSIGANGSHVTVNDFQNELKPNADVAKMHVVQLTPPHTPTTSQTSKNSSNSMPVLPSNLKRITKRTFETISKPKGAVQQNNKEILHITATTNNLNDIPSSMDTAMLSLTHQATSKNDTTSLKYPKPPLQYACLIALALKNSHTGSLLASEIYNFISVHFPYFRTSDNWKSNVRSNLANYFEIIEHTSVDGVATKSYLWTMRLSEIKKIDEKIQNCLRFKSMNIRSAMAKPEYLPTLIRGDMKHGNIARLNESIVPGNENKLANSALISEKLVQSDNDDKSSTVHAVDVVDSKLIPNKLNVEDIQLDCQPKRKRAQHDDDLSTERKLKSVKITKASGIKENEIEDNSHKELITANGLRMIFKDGFKPNTDVAKRHVVQPTLKLSHPPTMCSISKNPSKLLTALQSKRKQLAKRIIETIPKPKDVVQLDCEEILPFTKITTSTTNLKEISSSMDAAAIPSTSSSSLSSTPANSMTVREYSKPPFQYSCLIALALKNSRTGSLSVAEIYSFMCEHFPYFRTALASWKCYVQSNLAHRFDKIEPEADDEVLTKKSLWTMRPSEISDIDDKIQKCCHNSPRDVRKAMANPEHLPSLIRGDMKHGNLNDNLARSDGTVDSENGNGPAEDIQRARYGNDSSIAPNRIKTSTVSNSSKSQSNKFNGTEMHAQKPSCPYSCLIGMALKNSSTGSLPVTEIYRFICEHFPYFETAIENWKHNIRNTLSSNNSFMNTGEHGFGASSKLCLWSMNPMHIKDLDKKIQNWSQNADGCDSLTVPAMIHGKVKHDSMNEKIIGLEITNMMNDSSASTENCFEHENEPVDSVNNDEGNVQVVSECDNEINYMHQR